MVQHNDFDTTIDGINSVFHRKFMIVDDRISFIGSLNIGQEYLYEDDLKIIEGNPRGIPPDPKLWHDGLFAIEGEEFAKRLNTIFAQHWMVEGGDVYDLPDISLDDDEGGEDVCAIFFTFPGNPVNVTHALFQSMVSFCRNEIIIENPYILSEPFWEILSLITTEQAKKIRIITDLKKTDHKFAPDSFKANAEGAYKKGVRFYDYSECECFSHWKILAEASSKIVFHGSTNLNARSASYDFELDVLVKSPPVYKDIKQLLNCDINSSKQINYKDVDGNILDNINEMAVYFS